MLSCFPDSDNGETKEKNNRKRLSYICFKKLHYFECSTLLGSNLISVLLIFTKIFVVRRVEIKLANDHNHILGGRSVTKLQVPSGCAQTGAPDWDVKIAPHMCVFQGERCTSNLVPPVLCTQTPTYTLNFLFYLFA